MAGENQYLQSVGLPEVSYFDARLGGEVNKNYQIICNLIPYKAPYYQQSILEDYDINPREKGNPDYFFMKCRDGFTAGLSVSNDFTGYHFTDSITLNDTDTLYLAINYDKSLLKIGKKVTGSIVDITDNFYSFGGNTLPFEPGLSEKFTRLYFPGGTPRYFFASDGTYVSTSGIYKWNEVDGYYLTDQNILDQNNIYDQNAVLAGDYIYNIDTGEVGEVTSVYPDKIKISGAWLMDIKNPQVLNIKYIIFPKRQDTAVFSTSNGICQYHGTGLGVEIFPAGAAYGPNLDISSMVSHQDNFYMLDRKSGRLYFGNHGTEQLVIPYDNYIDIGFDYKWMSRYQDYIILLGETSIGAAFPLWTQITSTETIFNMKVQELVNQVGCFGEFAFDSFYKGFYFVAQNGVIYSLNITALYTGILVPDLQVQSNYAVDHLKRVSENDVSIKLVVTEDIIKIYIVNKIYPILPSSYNTKILVYDGYYRFWYHRMMTDLHFFGEDTLGYYYGIGSRLNSGDTDNGTNIKQILGGMFGDLQPFQIKYFTIMKSLIGQNCKYTDFNSELKARFDLGGRSRILTFAQLSNSGYVDTVMKRHMGGDVYQPPDGTTILVGNGVPGGLQLNFANEVAGYVAYENTMTTIMTANYLEQVAKWGTMRRDLVEFANIIYFELIAKNGDKIDTGGFMLGYTNADTDSERFDDILGLSV